MKNNKIETSKTVKSVLKSFKQLENFDELHDLNDIIDIYDISKMFIDNLNSYYTKYVNSFLMSKKDVIDYIPVSEHDEYKVLDNCYTGSMRYVHKSTTVMKEDKSGKPIWIDKKLSFSSQLSVITAQKGKAQKFLVNTIDKIIVPVDWCYNTSNTTMQDIVFEIDKNNNRLILNAHYLSHELQAVGGCWINGRKNGYLSGHTYNKYDLKCKQVHIFCTKTNRYLGRLNDVELEKRRKWIDTNSNAW